MSNEQLTLIQLYKFVKIHSKVSRRSWSRLWYLCRGCDESGSGRVVLLKPEIYTLLCCSRATLYRWLKEGKEAGAFRHYESEGHYLTIYLGSRDKICFSNWGSVTELPLWQVLSDGIDHQGLRQQATLHQAQHLQTRSKAAAVKTARHKKDKRRLASIDFRRATENNQTCQFFRNKIPIGTCQETIGATLEISDRSIRRHLAANKVQRVQAFYKVPKKEGEAELFFDREARKKPKIFYRKGEYWRFGTNQYNLRFEQKTQWTARLKHKWKLLKVFRSRPEDQIRIAYELLESFCSRLDCVKIFLCKNFLEFKKELTRQIRSQPKFQEENQGGQK